MSELLDLWRDVGKRVGFYTIRTRDQIPESAGLYAWFVPLWRYSDDPEVLLASMQRLLMYDPKGDAGAPIRHRNIDFNWDRTNVTLTREGKPHLSQKWRSQWERMLSDPGASKVFEKALMEATLLTPPLYVGKADNLRVRYQDHVKGSGKNDFHRRFSEFLEFLPEITLSVADLLFVCIELEPEVNRQLRAFGLNELLEKIMHRTCRPPFSER